MDKAALFIGILGALGLGVLLGSEFHGRYVTIVGASIVIITLISMAALSYGQKKKK